MRLHCRAVSSTVESKAAAAAMLFTEERRYSRHTPGDRGNLFIARRFRFVLKRAAARRREATYLVRHWRPALVFWYGFCVRMRALIPLVLPWALLGAQELPSRSLLPELAVAEQGGVSASVHTPYALTNGLLVARGMVVSARHSVMKPGGGGLAEEIGVGYARPPLDNVTESRSAAIAEDPGHDLILLRLLDEPPTPAAIPAKLAPCRTAGVHKARARREPKPQPVRVARFVRVGAPVRVQVIKDGPAAKQKSGA